MRSDERDFRELIRPLRRRWWLIVAVAVAVSGGTWLHYKDRPSTYSASTSVYLGGSVLDGLLLGTGTGVGSSPRTIQNQALLLKTRPVAQRAAQKLGFKGDPLRLLGQVNAVPLADSDFLQIAAAGGTGQAAVAIANAFAQSFVELRSKDLRDQAADARRDIEAQIKGLGKSVGDVQLRRTLEGRAQRLRFLEAVPAGQAEQVDRARVAKETTAQPVRNAIFAGILGLILGSLVVYGLHLLDRRLRGGDVESDYQAPLLALLPDNRRAVDESTGGRTLAKPLLEPVRMLRTALAVNTTNGSGPPRTILVASAIPEEGKSTLTRSLAMAYFEAGLRVLVIDADLRKPTLAASFGVEPAMGLADILLGKTSLSEAVCPAPLETGSVPEFLQRDQRLLTEARRAHDTPLPIGNWGESEPSRGPQVAVLAAGSQASDPAALFGTRRMAALLEEAAASYDMVLIDTAPLLAVSDSIPLLPQVDGVLLVTRVNHTTRDDAKRARLLIGRVPHIRILGVVANGTTSDDAPYPYAYQGSAP